MTLQAVRKLAASGRDQSIELLRSLVDVNSYWGNAEGVNRVGDLVVEAVPASMKSTVFTDPAGINHHLITSPAARGENIFLVGHLDTVFPLDLEGTPFAIGEGRIIGPGTADMKGGVAVMVRALQILHDLGLLERMPIQCLLNGDEEIGSPFSSELVRDHGSKARWGLIFECAGPGNAVVVGRRGVTRCSLTVTGQARHAGVKKGPKASAIVELSRLVLALEQLNDVEKGVSINVGVIRGGTANNIVPDHAEATFEFRFQEAEAEKETLEKVRDIIASVDTPGCGAVMETLHRRPCMVRVPGSSELIATLMDASKELGQEVATEERGGASDGNFLSEMGVPVIDGLGPVGDDDHSPNEYILEKSLYERIELTALLLVRLAGIKG